MVCLFLAIALATPALARISEPVTSPQSTATLVAEVPSVRAGDAFWVALKLELADGWHSYWQNPGDSGFATTIDWQLPDGVEAGAIEWQVPLRFEAGGIVSYGYADEVYHFVRMVVPEGYDAATLPLHARANWLVCEEICIPESAELALSLPVSDVPAASDAAFEAQRARLPEPYEPVLQASRQGDALSVTLPAALGQGAEFFPLDAGVIRNDTLPQRMTEGQQEVLRFAVGDLGKDAPQDWRAVVRSERGVYAVNIHTQEGAPVGAGGGAASPSGADTGLLLALALAFGGGVILNLMPCVLPVLSLKLLALARHHGQDHGHRALVRHGLAYSAGVVLSFVVIAAALLAIRQAGSDIGWGFQLQSPAFVASLALVMLAVGLSLSGVYEIRLGAQGAGQALTERSGAWGSFFTGTLAVLVATPCTAPLMAPALGYALTQPPLGAVLVFAALGAGMAAPFLLLSLRPALLARLPRPGAWMLRFKQCLAFPMYATAAWLAWVLTRQEGAQALAWLLALGVMVAWLLWAYGVSERHARRRLWLVLMLALSVAGIFQLAGLRSAAMLEERSEAYSAQRLEELRAQGTPVFVYATADWCITCKVNEQVALRSQRVMDAFTTAGVSVLRADWTHYDKAITEYLRSHGRAGVPLYVYYPAGGEPVILPQLLSPSTVVEALQ